MAKMRTTTRGGRQGKAKHNDRTYLPPEERPRENRYSYVGQKNAPNLTFNIIYSKNSPSSTGGR